MKVYEDLVLLVHDDVGDKKKVLPIRKTGKDQGVKNRLLQAK